MTEPGTAWIDGRLVSVDEPALLPTDRGFALGDGLFETVLVRSGRPFRLGAHLGRLARGADVLGIPLPGGLTEVVEEVLRVNGIGDGGLRITASRGPAPPGLAPPRAARPTVVVSARSCTAPSSGSERGLRVVTGGGRIAEGGLTSGIKMLAYGERVAALREARALGADDALIRNGRGDVVGGTASNIVFLRGGRGFTPSDACGALPGITREVALEEASALGIEFERGPVQPSSLHEAEEILLTSSLRGIVPVVSVDGRPVGAGEPGPAARALRPRYEARIALESQGG